MSQLADSFMSIFGMKRAECKSCLHSVGCPTSTGIILYCERHEKDTKTVSQCDDYCYEPGTDTEE